MKLWRTRNAASASPSPHGTDTFLIWKHFPITNYSDLFLLFPCHQSYIESHRQPLHKYMQIQEYSRHSQWYSHLQLYANNRRILSTANGIAIHKYMQITGEFSAQPIAPVCG